MPIWKPLAQEWHWFTLSIGVCLMDVSGDKCTDEWCSTVNDWCAHMTIKTLCNGLKHTALTHTVRKCVISGRFVNKMSVGAATNAYFQYSQIIFWSAKCIKFKKKKNVHYNFPEPKLTYSYCLFCLTNTPNPKDFQFIVIAGYKKTAEVYNLDAGISKFEFE